MSMSYLYRRQRGLVDLLIQRIPAKKVVIKDQADGEGGEYLIVLNGFGFRQEDPNPAVDSSGPLATAFASDINASTVNVVASVDGSSLLLIPERSVTDLTQDFSLEVSTTDEGGSIFYKDEKPSEYQVKQADNWDGTFTLMETVKSSGKVSPSAPREDSRYFLQSQSTRFRFHPADYDLIEDDHYYFRIAPVINGVAQDDSRIITVPGYSWFQNNQPPLIYTGEAPRVASEEEALTILLPLQCSSINVVNYSETATVYLSFGNGPGEIIVGPGKGYANNSIGVSSFSVRTAAGDAEDALVNITMISMNHHE